MRPPSNNNENKPQKIKTGLSTVQDKIKHKGSSQLSKTIQLLTSYVGLSFRAPNERCLPK